MAITSLPILGRGHSGWSHLKGVVFSETRLPLVHNEMCDSFRCHYPGVRGCHAELVTTMWFTAVLVNN